jgi:cell wall-associated NlpC family hydrolase
VSAERLAAAVDAVRADAHRRWTDVIDTTVWRWDDGVQVDGAVLVAAQADAYRGAIGAALGLAAVPGPAVLADLARPHREYCWGELVGDGLTDVHRGPDGADRQTQWSAGARVRLFRAGRTRWLVQLPDGTLGWVDRERVVERDIVADPWSSWVRPRTGEVVDGRGSIDDLTRIARRRLGRPYLWGGNGEEAADCSGFVQGVVAEASSVLLPKHTGDQQAFGVRVAQTNIAPGDLVFVRGLEKNLGHVGLALPGSVVHACLSRGRVLEEPLAAFFARYRFSTARRVVSWRS